MSDVDKIHDSAEGAFTIKIADKVIAVKPVTSSLRGFCKDYLISNDYSFQDNGEVGETEDNHRMQPDLTVTLTEEDIEREKQLAVLKSSVSYLETLVLERKILDWLLQFNVVMFHASCITFDGYGICFTASSGVGKSTHTRLWKRQFADRVEYVNDDKPFLKITESGVTAYGSPWNGSAHLSSNISAPVRAVCLLSRSETNHIEPVCAEDAFPYLFGQIYRPHKHESVRKVLELTDMLSHQADLYSSGCNMDPEAVITVYEGITRSLR